MQKIGSLSNKIVSLVLAFVLAVPNSVFAGEGSTGTPASRTQVALAISLPDDVSSFLQEHGNAVLLTVAAVGCMGSGLLYLKASNTFTKEMASAKTKIKLLEEQLVSKEQEMVKAATSSAEREVILKQELTKAKSISEKIKQSSFESAFQKGRTQGFQQGRASLEPKLSQYANTVNENTRELLVMRKEIYNLGKANKAKRLEIEYFTDELARLQQKLAARERVIGVQDDITKLVLKINADMTALQTAKGAQASQLAASIEASVSKLAAVKVPNSTLREAVTKFLEETVRILKGKGGILCMTALAVAGTALALLSSNETSTSVISNSRLAVTRIMNATYTETPELLFITTQQLKKKYGDAVVVDVVYENQEKYLPVLKFQSAVLQNKEIRNSANNIAKYIVSSTERNKAVLLNSLAG